MEILSNRILNMAESETLAMTAKARELKAQGKDVISLSIGEPDFNMAARRAEPWRSVVITPSPRHSDIPPQSLSSSMRFQCRSRAKRAMPSSLGRLTGSSITSTKGDFICLS